MQHEVWQPVKGFEKYYVSNTGKVKGSSGSILKPGLRQGYKVVYLSINHKKHKTIGIHRLVANAFIPNPENKPEIDHINRDRTDNRVENLRWVTHEENANNPLTLEYKRKTVKRGVYSVRFGKVGKLNGKSKTVYQFTKEGVFIRKFESVRQAGIITGICKRCIAYNASNKTKSAGGYIWKYEQL